MIVDCLAFYNHWVLVEYEEGGLIQRRLLPRLLVPTNLKGQTRISDETVEQGLEYSDVDLTSTLGATLPAVNVVELQDKLRRRGIWRKEDYKEKSSVVVGVIAQVRGLDLATVTNAAIQCEASHAKQRD